MQASFNRPLRGKPLSKYLIKESRKGAKFGVSEALDTYSFSQLLKEHRIWRDHVYVIGVPCEGKVDVDTVKSKGIKGICSMPWAGTAKPSAGHPSMAKIH